MRVALIWNHPDRLCDVSIRYEWYLQGFRELGHDAFIVAAEKAALGFAEPVSTVGDAVEFTDARYWESLRLDAAVIVTWFGMAPVLVALKQACPYVVAVADSDAQVGARVHPGPLLRRMLSCHRRWGMQLRALKYWAMLYARGDTPDVRGVLDNVRLADVVVVHSRHAAASLQRFLDYYRESELGRKVFAVPYPINPLFVDGPVRHVKVPQAVAIGRWDDIQKDAPFLCKSVSRFYASGGKARLTLIGRGGEPWFPGLASRYPQVRYLGVQPANVVADELRESQVLLLTSRWDSGPIVASEALAQGCTVVGPQTIPYVADICEERTYGTAYRRQAAAAAAALRAELAAWEEGDRDPIGIAEHWRATVGPAVVCRRLLERSRHSPHLAPKH